MANALIRAAVAGMLVAATGAAAAADWAPSKPVRMIVGFPPGGATDLVARIIQPKMSAALGKQVIVDNRPARTACSRTTCSLMRPRMAIP